MVKFYYFLHIGNEAIVKILDEHGANINKENIVDETPLSIAYERGYTYN